jgi:hypothetical protein
MFDDAPTEEANRALNSVSEVNQFPPLYLDVPVPEKASPFLEASDGLAPEYVGLRAVEKVNAGRPSPEHRIDAVPQFDTDLVISVQNQQPLIRKRDFSQYKLDLGRVIYEVVMVHVVRQLPRDFKCAVRAATINDMYVRRPSSNASEASF